MQFWLQNIDDRARRSVCRLQHEFAAHALEVLNDRRDYNFPGSTPNVYAREYKALPSGSADRHHTRVHSST